MSTGHGSPRAAPGSKDARPTTRPPTRTDTSSSPDLGRTRLGASRRCGADGDLPARGRRLTSSASAEPADALGRGERRLPADLDDGGPDGHLEHVLGAVGGLDVGVEEVGDDVGEGRRVVEDLLRRPDVARRLVVERVVVDVVGDDELAPARRSESDDLRLAPRPRACGTPARPSPCPATLLLNTWTAPMLTPALPHSWASGRQLAGAVRQVRAHPPQHVHSMPYAWHAGAVPSWIYLLHPPREDFAATMTDDEAAVFGEHFEHLSRLLADGVLVAGRAHPRHDEHRALRVRRARRGGGARGHGVRPGHRPRRRDGRAPRDAGLTPARARLTARICSPASIANCRRFCGSGTGQVVKSV